MPTETRYYVPKLQAVKNIIANPAAYGVRLPEIPDHPYFVTVTTSRDIDVALAAKLANMPLDEFKALNPSFNRPVILGAANPQILLPFLTSIDYDKVQLLARRWRIAEAVVLDPAICFGKPIIDNWVKQLDFTTKMFRARGLHLDDRHIRPRSGGFSASIVDTTLFIVNNYKRLRQDGSSLVLYLPKIQTAEEAALWSNILSGLEQHLGLPDGTIKVYVLVEQVEQCFQLMEIRAALGQHFIGFNTGRWDYINSVSDAMAWDNGFINPNIDAITMTYGYMRIYEDRVRRACLARALASERACRRFSSARPSRTFEICGPRSSTGWSNTASKFSPASGQTFRMP